jgi:sugar lactone lactonase YvrE
LLWWTDIQGRELYRYDWARSSMQVLDTPERVGSFGFVADSERLIIAFASGITLYDAHEATVEWLARPTDLVAAGLSRDRVGPGRFRRNRWVTAWLISRT